MTKRSTYDLRASYNYLRLAFQSMHRDQDEAERAVSTVATVDATVEERLSALAQLVAWKAANVESSAQ